MRILYVNWADPHDPLGRGGGVSVYQRNLIAALDAVDGVETAFLGSGLTHDLVGNAPRVQQISDGPSPRFQLVNSGLLAPSHADFAGAAQLDHPPTVAAFADFIDRSGPWDVIHFNTLEGLPAQVLALKPRWPRTRFVMSLHNYYPFCPQVNLWHHEARPCTDFQDGAKCVTCLPAQPNPRNVRLSYRIDTALTRAGAGPGTALFDRVFRPLLGLTWRLARRVLRARHRRRARARGTAPNGRAFARRRAEMTALINTHVDAVLCVSDRVRQIALQHGLDGQKTQTCLIGTRAAQAWGETRPKPAFLAPDGTLRLLYLGYMRRDKGFYFLMQALGALPSDMARRLHLLVAARSGEADAMALMSGARTRLASLTHVNGYTHDDLPGLLDGADLGVVPPLWEDNLPQVAIEMHALHIPLLTSDKGGAQELGNCPDLVFRSGDAADFQRALSAVLAGRLTPADYWANARPPETMAAHVKRLLAIYRGCPSPRS